MRNVLLLILAAAFVLGAAIFSKTEERKLDRVLPARERARPAAVASAVADGATEPDPLSRVDSALKSGDDDELEALMAQRGLPATAKAHLIDAVLVRQDSRLLAAAQELIREMVERGSLAEALAAIPKISYFGDAAAREIAKMQSSLCRFQEAEENEFGFEAIKVKFTMILGKDPAVKPWADVCGAS